MKKFFLSIILFLYLFSSSVLAEDKEINIDCSCQKAESENNEGFLTPMSCNSNYIGMELNRLSGSFITYDPPLGIFKTSDFFLADPITLPLKYSKPDANFYEWKISTRHEEELLDGKGNLFLLLLVKKFKVFS